MFNQIGKREMKAKVFIRQSPIFRALENTPASLELRNRDQIKSDKISAASRSSGFNRMIAVSSPNITELLIDWQQGNQGAIEALTPLIYDELRRLAHRYVRRERNGHTRETTA